MDEDDGSKLIEALRAAGKIEDHEDMSRHVQALAQIPFCLKVEGGDMSHGPVNRRLAFEACERLGPNGVHALQRFTNLVVQFNGGLST